MSFCVIKKKKKKKNGFIKQMRELLFNFVVNIGPTNISNQL
jgi:hypothetical protein